MRHLTLLAVFTLCSIADVRLLAQDKPTRRWDQAKGEQLVEKTLAVEKQGTDWDRIPWSTDVDAVVAQAQQEDKPIFVYWYVKAGGPATAPC